MNPIEVTVPQNACCPLDSLSECSISDDILRWLMTEFGFTREELGNDWPIEKPCPFLYISDLGEGTAEDGCDYRESPRTFRIRFIGCGKRDAIKIQMMIRRKITGLVFGTLEGIAKISRVLGGGVTELPDGKFRAELTILATVME